MATNQEKIDYLLSLKPEETGPSNEEKRAYLLQQQKNNVQPQVEQTQIDQEQPQAPLVNTLPFMDRGQIPEPEYTSSIGFGGKSSDELKENVYKSFDNAGLGFMRTINETTDALLSKWMGEITSMPAAIKGAEFGAKLPIGHPALKGLAVLASSAGAAGIGQFFGELGEDVWNGTAVDYHSALEEGLTTAKWDAGGGLVLGTLGTLSKKALRANGIESTGDAVKIGREILQKYGADLSWYQATGSKMSAIFEGIARAGLGSKEILDNAFLESEKALQKNLDELFTTQTREGFGEQVQGVLTATRKALSKEYSPQYDAIYKAGENIPVDLRTYNTEIVQEVKKAAGARKNKMAKGANPFINDVNTIALDLDSVTDMSTLNTTLKDLRAIKRDAVDAGGNAGKIGVNYANKQIKKLEEIMGQAAQKLDPALKGKLDLLNRNYASSVTRLNNKTMKVVAKRDPAKVGDWVYTDPARHKDFMKFLGQARNSGAIDKATHHQILEDYRSGYIKKLIAEEGATTAAMSALAKKLRKAKEGETLRAVVGISTQTRLKNILNTAELTQKTVAAKLSLIVGSRSAEALKYAMLGGTYYSMGLTSALSMLMGPVAMAKAASSAKTLGQWMSYNAGLKAASKSGDLKKLDVLTRRLTQWTSEEKEE